MAIHPGIQDGSRPPTRAARVLERLVSERVVCPYVLFFVTGEGTFFPNGIERVSGFVLDQNDRAWAFWTGWDPNHNAVTLTEWESVFPDLGWLQDEEYLQARTALGLPI